MGKVIILLMIGISSTVNAQNCTDSYSLFQSKGKEFALQLLQKISPNTGRAGNITTLKNSPEYFSSENKCKLPVKVSWIAKECQFCNYEMNFYILGDVVWDYYRKAWIFEVTYENEAVIKANKWRDKMGVGGLLLSVGTVIYALSKKSNSSASSSNSGNAPEKKTRSHHTKKSSNSNTYSGASVTQKNDGFKYEIGRKGYMEIPFTMSNGSGIIGGLLFKSKYVLRFLLTINDRKLSNGEQYYKFYISGGEVGYGSNWVSYNTIKGKSKAEERCKKVMAEYIGTYTKYLALSYFGEKGVKM